MIQRSTIQTIILIILTISAIVFSTGASLADSTIKPVILFDTGIQFSGCYFTGCGLSNWYMCPDQAMKNPLSWEKDVYPHYYKTYEFTTTEEGWIWFELESEVPTGATKPMVISSVVFKTDTGTWTTPGRLIIRTTKNVMGNTSLSREKPIDEARVLYKSTMVDPGAYVGPAKWKVTVDSASNWGCGMPYDITGVVPCTGRLTVKFVPQSLISCEGPNADPYLNCDNDGDTLRNFEDMCPNETGTRDTQGCPPGNTPDISNKDKNVTVIPPIPPPCTACISAIASSSRGNKTSGAVPLTIDFKDCSYPDPIIWSWDFGDGNHASIPDAQWVYTTAGTFTPTLTVTCKDGSKDITSTTIEAWSAEETSCPVSFSATVNPNNRKEVTLTPVIPCSGVQTIKWKFGDGFGTEYLVSMSPYNPDPYVRVYDEYGTYTVTMEAVFSTDTERSSQTVVLSPPAITTPAGTPTPKAGSTSYTTITSISPLTGSFTVDSAENVYIGDSDTGTIIKIAPDGSEKTYGSNIDRPRSPVIDKFGNLYVGSYDGTIQKISPDGTKEVVASGIWSPQGMGFDDMGILYVASYYDGNIYKITQSGSVSTISSGFTHPKYLAVTPPGDIYIIENDGTLIQRITPEGGYASLVDIGVPIKGMAMEGEKIFISYDDRISGVDSYGKITPLITGLNQPTSLSVQNGIIYVTVTAGTVKIQ